MFKISLGSTNYLPAFVPDSAAVSMMYSFLFIKKGIIFKDHISINQIGSDLNEVIVRHAKNHIGINVRLPLPENLGNFSSEMLYQCYLGVLHEGMLRLSRQGFINVPINDLESIRNDLLVTGFQMDVVYKTFLNVKDTLIIAKVIINPKRNVFDIYIALFINGEECCRYLIFKGKTDDWYLPDLFGQGKWKKNIFVLTGKESEVEFHLDTETCSLEMKYKPGSNGKSPKFNINKIDAGQKELDEYLRSLNPAIAAVIMQSRN